MTKDEAIKIIQTEMECVSRPDCDRLACAYCDLAMRAEDVLTAYQMAIEALQTDGDCISRRVALDAIIAKLDAIDHVPQWVFDELTGVIGELPSVQQEPLSDAYMKAVWTWLLNYQIKAAELKGRYTPYEVLSWVANDWRKEHEGLD